jgi:drug/metabolite transporter (DMT)-like permease
LTLRHAGLLAALAAIWGASYLLIKYGLEDFDPAFIVWARTALGAAVLLAVMGGENRRIALGDLRARPRRALLLGFTAVALPFILISFGELEVPSGLTAVLLAPASIFVAMFAPFLDRTEQVDAVAGIGMGIGLAGVALLVGVESVSTLWQFLGALAIVGAAISYALSSFVVKAHYSHLPSIAASALSVGTASVLVLPAALLSLPSELPGLRSVLAVFGLAALGTSLAFVIFYKLIAEIGAGRASLISYLAPGVALLYGALLLDEAISPAGIGGLALILFGVALASRGSATLPEEPALPQGRSRSTV